MSISAIPREIIDNVFLHLEWPEVRNLRLASRRLAEVGVEYFPRKVTLVATKWSLQRVENLLSLEPVRRNIRSLSICCYVFLPEGEGQSNFVPDPDVRRTVKKTFNRHCNLIKDGDYSTSLEAILRKLPSLESIVISDYPRSKEILPRSQFGKLPHRHYLSGEGAAVGKEDLLKLVEKAVIGKLRDQSQASQKPNVSLEHSYCPYGLEDNRSEWLRAGLESVTHLKLGMSYENHEEGFWDAHIQWLTRAGRFTSKAQNLESIDLTVTSSWGTFEDFSKDLKLPKLKRFAVSEMFFDQQHIFPFFETHSATLKSLSFNTTSMNNNHSKTSWFKFFEDLPETLSLESLELSVLLQQSDAGSNWPIFYPDTVPTERAIRYLVCGQKTNMRGEPDAISEHPYDWESLSWAGVESDFAKLSRPIRRNDPIPQRWRKSLFAPKRWIPTMLEAPQPQQATPEHSPAPSQNMGNTHFVGGQDGSGVYIQGPGIQNVTSRKIRMPMPHDSDDEDDEPWLEGIETTIQMPRGFNIPRRPFPG